MKDDAGWEEEEDCPAERDEKAEKDLEVLDAPAPVQHVPGGIDAYCLRQTLADNNQRLRHRVDWPDASCNKKGEN